MTYRTEQDKINRREANQRYYRMEENKEQKREYMRNYISKKNKKNIYIYHEEWAEKNGYRTNDTLNSKNTVGFKDGAER
tara:strand:- start:1014 stop:1250 length:237 start_codon:yes stop_codon:yes gene_type:complete